LTGLEALECSRFLGAHRLSNLQKFFDQLLDLAIETRGSSALTLRGLRVPIVDVEDEEEAIPGGESVDAVRIMSIHKAKGLSFQQVYLLGISGNGKQTHRSFDAAVRGANGRLEWKIGEGASFGYPAFESRETQIRNAEFVRLWYVALTRAKVRVVTVGSSTGLGRDMKSFSDFLFSRKGPMPDLDQLLEWTQPIDDAEEMSFSDSDTDEVLPDQLVALERAEKTVDGVRWVAVDYENLEQDAFGERQLDPIDMNPERVLEFNRMLAAKRDLAKEQAGRPLMMAPSKMMSKDEPQVEQQCAVGEGIGVSVAQSVGTALHLAFEVGDDSPDFAAASQWLKGALSETDLPKGLAVLSETQAALEGRCLLDRFQAIVPSILGREVPLMLKADEPDDEPVTGFSGSIDLLYTDPEDGAIVVADYKTDRVPESQLNAQAEHHRTQGELYTRAARSAFPGAPNYRFEVWFLNHDTII
jgi:ATP-dependent helicase/nuclease subunit A